MRFKTITISGLGGVGGYYGAMLLLAAAQEGQGRQIHFVARGAHRAAIAERGLHIHTPERDFTVYPDALAEDPRELPVTDLLILATKSYDLAANVEQLRPIIGPETIVLPLLNGANISDQLRGGRATGAAGVGRGAGDQPRGHQRAHPQEVPHDLRHRHRHQLL